MELIDKNRIFAAKLSTRVSTPKKYKRHYDKTITQPQYPPEDHPDPHHPTSAARKQLGRRLSNNDFNKHWTDNGSTQI